VKKSPLVHQNMFFISFALFPRAIQNSLHANS
jgi:hypothetical protein